MRKTLWYSILAGALLTAGGCKKDNSDTTDKAGTELRKAQEDVKDQAEDVRDEAKDVRDEAKDVRDEAKDVTGQAKDVAGEVRDLRVAEGDFAAARATYTAKVDERLAKLDAKLTELSAKTDAKAKQLATDLRIKRDAIAAKAKTIGTTAQVDFAKFTDNLDDSFDKVEHDLFDALD